MTQVNVRIFGDEEAQRMLREAGKRSRNLSPVFRGPVDKLVTKLFTDQFATEGKSGPLPWAPLSAATLADKARIRRGRMGVLRRFNTLWASLVKSGGPQGIRDIGPDRYERGTAVPYAAAHQLGARIRRWGNVTFRTPKRLPVRQVVPDPAPPRFVDAVARHVADFVAEG